MAWSKPSESLVATFEQALPRDERAERRKMFGFPCCFAGGNMFAGLWQDSMVLRLPDSDRDALLARPGIEHFEPMGRRMREYVRLTPAVLADAAQLRAWIGASFAYALSLPAKAPKPRQPKKKQPSIKGKLPELRPARQP